MRLGMTVRNITDRELSVVFDNQRRLGITNDNEIKLKVKAKYTRACFCIYCRIHGYQPDNLCLVRH